MSARKAGDTNVNNFKANERFHEVLNRDRAWKKAWMGGRKKNRERKIRTAAQWVDSYYRYMKNHAKRQDTTASDIRQDPVK